MYRNLKIDIHKKDPLFSYLDDVAHAANNLYNAALFRQRQVMSGLSKEEDERTENEKEVLKEIDQYFDAMNAIREETYKKRLAKGDAEAKPHYFEKPTKEKFLLSSNYLDALFKVSDNVDYRNPVLPTCVAQPLIKLMCTDIKGYFKALKTYKKNPDVFTGRPKLPHYKESGCACTFTITNGGCKVKNGRLQFPKTKLTAPVTLPKGSKLMEVKVSPWYESYRITITYDAGEAKLLPEDSKRICAIDLGVKVLAAIVTNTGGPCALLKGRDLASMKELENLQMSEYVSIVSKASKDGRMHSTKRLKAMNRKNAARTADYLHCAAKKIVDWCIEQQIDTVVIGSNKLWKQKSNMGKSNNRKFGKIPFDTLKWDIQYRCEAAGIRFVEAEESYTSKASYLDGDDIPTYKKDSQQKHRFSGKRKQRGQYVSAGGRAINADLNGAANIGRKHFPEQFSGVDIPFDTIEIL